MSKLDVQADLNQVEQQALEWLLRLQDGELDDEGREAWFDWLRCSDEHIQAFDRARALWEKLDQLALQDDIPLPSEFELHRDEYCAEQSVTEWLEGSTKESLPEGKGVPGKVSINQTHRVKQLLRWPVWAAAASLLVVLFAWQGLYQHEVPDTADSIQTQIAEHRSVTLPDGSRVHLAANSIVMHNFTQQQRALTLVRGEAYFEVAKKPQRPFVVTVNGFRVQALGTAFNIRQDDIQARVVVTEGRVEVVLQAQQQQLGAGQGLKVAAGHLGEVETVDIDSALAWRQGLLVFVDEPLVQVINRINRYTDQKLVFGDDSLKQLSLTGTADVERIDQWLDGVSLAYGLRVSRISPDTALLFAE